MIDDSVEEEETLVLVELSGIIDSNFLLEKQKSMKVLGIESDNPVLQLENCVFSGSYEDFRGTEVIFEEVKDKDGETKLKYFGKTIKKLAMKRVFLEKKKFNEDSVPVEEMDTVSLSDKENSGAEEAAA